MLTAVEPKIVAKRQKRLSGVDEMVISLSAKGLTTGGVQAHLAEVWGAEVSRQTISTITDSVPAGMAEWQNRPLDPIYPTLYGAVVDGGTHRGIQVLSPEAIETLYRRAAFGMMGYGGQIGFGDPAGGVDIGFTRSHLSHTSPLGGLLVEATYACLATD